MESKPAQTPLVVIVGETASGKTAAAIQVAKKVDGEIICADSRTVYKKMDIGTAKPSLQEQQNIPHHLINIVEPDETFSVARFQELANKCIQEVANRGRTPIVVGGTGLYIDALLYNFQFLGRVDTTTRLSLEQMTDDELTTILNTKNINTDFLNTKNRRHVIRAIERNGAPKFKQELRDRTVVLGITLDRDELRSRVTKRVELMFDNGFLEEACQLLEVYGPVESLKTPGYSAVTRYLNDEISESELRSAFVQADMKLAKRQRTWFKRSDDIDWFADSSELVEAAVEFVKQGGDLV